MPIYTEITEPEFAHWERQHRWFAQVLAAEYGELAHMQEETPADLNWLEVLPLARRYDFEDVECGMAYVSPEGGYACTVWDVSGPDDDPWAVFVVDDYGARLLPEYSLLDDEEEMTEDERAATLARAAEEIPERAEAGEFVRSGTPLTIPDWLQSTDEELD